jgi:hypothetical protein
MAMARPEIPKAADGRIVQTKIAIAAGHAFVFGFIDSSFG